MKNHEQLIREWVERINRADIEGAAALAAEDLVNHAAIPEAQGRAGMVRILGKLRTAFPDYTLTVEDLLADGDRVVVRTRVRGTHQGPITFLKFPVAATGRKVESEQIHIFRVDGGKLAEHWAGRDDIGMLRQLGVLDQLAA